MKLVYEGHSSDGQLSVIIGTDIGVFHYTYTVDIARISNWRKRMLHQPGQVLNEIKNTATNVVKL